MKMGRRFTGAVLLCVLAMPLASAHHLISAQRANYCWFLSYTYSAAASMRDLGMSPQQVYATKVMHESISHGIPAAQVKHAINNVFFNKAFALPPSVIQNAVMHLCAHPNQGFKPLR